MRAQLDAGRLASVTWDGVGAIRAEGPGLVASRTRMGRLSLASKTAFDLTVATIMLVIILPVMLVLAALIKLDGGSAFFAHPRVGRDGKSFACLKFRSMVSDPEQVLTAHLAANPAAAAEWHITQKLRDDPRVTRIGRFLRSSSLDELPQLINVLRLDMSLVGPRPIVQTELVRYGEDVHYYLAMRPGITGAWQISGRSNLAYHQRVELDASYVRNWAFWRDIVILANTIPAVLRRDGAH